MATMAVVGTMACSPLASSVRLPNASNTCRLAYTSPQRGISVGGTSGKRRIHTPVAISDSTSTSSPDTQKKTQYHFLVANAKFMLDEEEHLQELLRERLRNYGERNKEQDFWLVIEPKFIDKFPDLASRVNRPAVALISTDSTWITFMKLRIDRVLKGVVEAESLKEVAESNPVEVRFNQPEKWTAPYPKYESGWWTPLLPPK